MNPVNKQINRILPKDEIYNKPLIEPSIINRKQNMGVWIEQPTELYVIGDIHGDFFALKQALELTGCVIFSKYTEELRPGDIYTIKDGCEFYTGSQKKGTVTWNPNKINCSIVIAGDLVDRCRSDYKFNCLLTINDENCDYLIYKLLFDLNNDANNYNSFVIPILGNHELMNMNKNFSYVSLKGLNDEKRFNNIYNLLNNNKNKIYGIVRIGNYIILHGGINNIFFNKLNSKIINIYNMFPIIETIEIYNYILRKFLFIDPNNKILTNSKSPFYDRTIGGLNPLNDNQCNDIFNNNILNIPNYGFLKIIVAHCPQFSKQEYININDCQEYQNRLYRIDVGMSRAFDKYKQPEILYNILNKPIENIINMNETELIDYNNIENSYNTRKVSILKITHDKEETIHGILSFSYFCKIAFKNNFEKYLYLFSDIRLIYQKLIRNTFDVSLINNVSNCIKLINKKINELEEYYLRQSRFNTK